MHMEEKPSDKPVKRGLFNFDSWVKKRPTTHEVDTAQAVLAAEEHDAAMENATFTTSVREVGAIQKDPANAQNTSPKKTPSKQTKKRRKKEQKKLTADEEENVKNLPLSHPTSFQGCHRVAPARLEGLGTTLAGRN